MQIETTVVRNRTLRRRQKAELIKELEADLLIVDRKRVLAITKKQVIAYDFLYGLLYTAYIDLVSSEV